MGPDLLHSGASIHRAALVPVWVVSHPIFVYKGSLAHLSRLQQMILIITTIIMIMIILIITITTIMIIIILILIIIYRRSS